MQQSTETLMRQSTESPTKRSMETPVKHRDVELTVQVPTKTEGRASPTTPRSSLRLPKSQSPKNTGVSAFLDRPFGVCLGMGLTVVWITAVFWAPLLWPVWSTSVLIGVAGLLVVYVNTHDTMTCCGALVAWAMASSAAGLYAHSNMGHSWSLGTARVSVREVAFVPDARAFAFTDGVVDYTRVFSGQTSGCSRSNNNDYCSTRTVFLTPVFAGSCDRSRAECFQFALIAPHVSRARARGATLPADPFAGRVCDRICGYRQDPRYPMDDDFRAPLEVACEKLARGLGAPNASGLADRCAAEYVFAGSPSEMFSGHRLWAIGLHIAAGVLLCLVQFMASAEKVTKTDELVDRRRGRLPPEAEPPQSTACRPERPPSSDGAR